MAAAAKLYELGRLSGGAAAQLAARPKLVFMAKLTDYGIPAFKLSDEEIAPRRAECLTLAPVTIANTSPLLYLHQCGLADLVLKVYEEILVPPAVVQELGRRPRAGIRSALRDRFSLGPNRAPTEHGHLARRERSRTGRTRPSIQIANVIEQIWNA